MDMNVDTEKTNAGPSYLFQPPPLFFLLFNPFLSLRQQLPLILLLLPELLLLQKLLSPQSLGAFLVLLLQPQEIPSQSRLSRHIDDGTARGRGLSGLHHHLASEGANSIGIPFLFYTQVS